MEAIIHIRLLEEINDNAAENRELNHTPLAKEVTYRLLLAKECEEKKDKKSTIIELQ